MAVRRESIRIAETTIDTEPTSDEPRFTIHHGDDADLPPFERAMHRMFLGPDGVRPIWRLVAAVALYNLLVFVVEALLATDPAIWAWMRSRSPRVLTPSAVIFGEALRIVAALATGLLMSRIEDRSFAEYGLPWRDAFGKRFWQGAAYGFALLTALMASIGALGGFSLGRVALGEAAAIRYGALYLLAFLLVGFFEEATFRGYLQATLAQEIGFWPSALALSVAFGLIHVRNVGEAVSGLLLAGCFGLLAAFSLRRTGTIWFAIGMHAAWDWGESYFYGVPNSGVPAAGHLTAASLHGPMWLTGGSVGPEGSALVFGVMAVGALGVHVFFRATRRKS
ncbi:MAG: type II CAAX endopeptidase family protein [Candidatus Acidiferrales bacterium]